MNRNITVKIIMPSDIIFEAEAKMINIPGEEGFFSVLFGHARFISTVAIGCISVFLDSEEKKFFVYKGIARVTPIEVCITSEFVVFLEGQDKNDVLSKISSFESELKSLKNNKLDSIILEDILSKYNSLLNFICK